MALDERASPDDSDYDSVIRYGEHKGADLDVKERDDRSNSRHGEKHKSSKDKKREMKEHGHKERDKSRAYDSAKEGIDTDRSGGGAKEKLRERDDDRDRREKDRQRERGDDERDRSKHREKEKEREHRVREKEDDRRRDRDERERESKDDRRRDREDRERDRGEVRRRGRDERERGKEDEHRKDRDEREKEKEDALRRAQEDGRRKDRDDRERDYSKEKYREREKDKDRCREKEREGNRAKDKERDRGKAKSRDSEKETDGVKQGEGKGEKIRSEATDYEEGEFNVVRQEESANDNIERDNLMLERSQPSTLELAQRIANAREKRMKKTDDSAEILAWVNMSRKLEEKVNAEKEKALQLAKVFEEQDNVEEEISQEAVETEQTASLAGVKILHGLEKVMEGGAVVLTLKDQDILSDGDINNEIDMLENVEIGEQKQRDEAYKAAKKKSGIYEDKFSVDAASQKTILSQYDDATKDAGVVLDESGRLSREAQKKLEELRKRLVGASASNQFEDLTTTTKVSSDYYTHEEMLQFRKPKKKKSLRKKEKLNLDGMEAEAKSAGLGIGDLGSRKDMQRQLDKEAKKKAEAEERMNSYKSAYNKAEEASRALREGQTVTISGDKDENPVFGDDDDLYKSLEKARKFSFKKQEEEAASGTLAVALRAVSSIHKSEEAENPAAGGSHDNNKIVFTEMEEFVWGLQLDEDSHKPDKEDVFKDDGETTESFEPEEDTGGGWMEVKDMEVDEPSEEKKEEIVLDETIHEIPVGKGLSGALQLLKERGTLKEAVDWGGRTMDKKKSKLTGIRDSDGPKEISLDRLDEFGRIMTPKEAFRKLSHKFHGKCPGKMKQEKRMKQYEEELKLKQMKASDTPLLSMEKMRETQAKLNAPYIVLSGQIKPGQTSDPRSGFATVEKDHPGNLTPMLGDRKVEHFLGIKRKAEPSNLGPAKKPKG
ncbi:unnamed protein product [Victoria cruziana]